MEKLFTSTFSGADSHASPGSPVSRERVSLSQAPLRFASLGSGSAGNSTLVQGGGTSLLIDCGFSKRETRQRLERLGVPWHDIHAILLTHEHSDHSRSVGSIARQLDIPVYTGAGTVSALERSGKKIDRVRIRRVLGGTSLSIGALQVRAVTVPHDCATPLQFCCALEGREVGVLTDLGHVPDSVVEAFSSCDAMLLESNHDLEMLRSGPYPMGLKRRIGGDLGHLSNTQSAQALRELMQGKLRQVVIGHVSRTNNDRALLDKAFAAFASQLKRMQFATQHAGSDWILA